MAKAFCPTGPGGGSDPSCGGGDSGGVPAASEAAIGDSYSGMTETAQSAGERFGDAVDGDGSADDRIGDIYEAHDELAADVEYQADGAADTAAEDVRESYRPDDQAQAADYDEDWATHEDEFRAATDQAKQGVLDKLGSERDLAEEVVLTEERGDDAAALRQQMAGAQDRLDSAAGRWMDQVTAATQQLVGRVDGNYGQEERSVETLAVIMLATLCAGHSPEWDTLLALRQHVGAAMETGFCPTGPGGGVDPSCGSGGGASFENAEAAEDHFSAEHKTKLRNGGKLSEAEFVKTAEKLSDEMDRLTSENKAVRNAIKKRGKEQELEVGAYMVGNADGQFREGQGIVLGHRLSLDDKCIAIIRKPHCRE